MGGLVQMAGGLVAVSLLGAGAGYGATLYLAPQKAEPASAEPAAAPAADPAAPGSTASGPATSGIVVSDLTPILTNLAHPSTMWVRAELSLLSRQPLAPGDAELVAQDLLAFLRTVRLDQVEGPSGFLTLREELDERAAIRTDGRATRVLVRTLLFE